MLRNKETFLLNHFKIIFKQGFKITTKFNHEYYKYIPHKYYKYREVNEDNLRAIKEEYIWLSTPDKFRDPLDSTVSFDVYKQKRRISKIIQKEMPILVFEELKKELTKKGVNPSVFNKMNLDDAIQWTKNYTFNNGKFKFGKIRGYLKNQGLAKRKSEEFEKKIRELTSESKCKDFYDNFMNAFSQLNIKIKQTYFIHSFAGSYDNPTLWENYTDNDKGFCIEYDLSLLEEIGFDKFTKLYQMWPIIYKNKEDIDLSELIRLSIKQVLKQRDIFGEYLLGIKVAINVMSKQTKYNYEDEWRLLIEKKKQKNNKFYFPFMSAIYLGINIKESDKKIIVDIAREKKIKVYQRTLNRFVNGYEFVSVNLESD